MGDIVGYYLDVSQAPHGLLRRNGRLTHIDYPVSPHTMAYGINDSGQIVGHFQDAKKVFHGFVARVTPASPAPAVFTVDDDGFDCPGALHTIQEAVAQAPLGAQSDPGKMQHHCLGPFTALDWVLRAVEYGN